MSAVLKELTISEPKTLTELLVISEQCPDDFYRNTALYQGTLDAALIVAKSLVHPIDDEGRKQAKCDAALIRKFAKTNNGFSLSIFKSLTEKVKLWRDRVTDKTKLLENEADNIMARFEQMEEKQLNLVRSVINLEITSQRTLKGVRKEFVDYVDITPLVKLTGTITPAQQLTKKANTFIAAIVDNELLKQSRFESRTLILENRCLRAEINPPLTSVHFGAVFNAEDEVFSAKVDELINTEIDRRAEMAARIEKQNEVANQKKLADALKAQQAEANRIALENLVKERPVEPIKLTALPEPKPLTPTELRAIASEMHQNAEYSDSNESRRREQDAAAKIRQQANELEKQQAVQTQVPANGKRTVMFSASFEVIVPERWTDENVTNLFMQKMPEDLLKIFKNLSFNNVG
ncbi:MAG: hypothetical protein RLZZ419_1802 [Pseudomonadota bacterium]